MRAVVQRVTSANVVGEPLSARTHLLLVAGFLTSHVPRGLSVDNQVISSIGRGLMVLVGIGTGLSPPRRPKGLHG